MDGQDDRQISGMTDRQAGKTAGRNTIRQESNRQDRYSRRENK
jgi:hypothetical protein